MLQNASLLAIVAVHTAENEPSEVGDAVNLNRTGQFGCQVTAPARKSATPTFADAAYFQAAASPARARASNHHL